MDNSVYENMNIERPQQCIEDMLQQLKDAVNKHWDIAQLYDLIKREILRELKFKNFGIVQIAKDLIEIRKKSPLQADILLSLLANPFSSYNTIAQLHHVTKQDVHYNLKQMKKYMWVEDLLQIKNENYNRNRTYNQGGRP